MASRTGKVGLVEYKGVAVLRINNWDASINTDMRDHTTFSTGTVIWRTTKPGLSGGSGDIFATIWLHHPPRPRPLKVFGHRTSMIG